MIPRMVRWLALAGCVATQARAATHVLTLVTEPDQGIAPIYNLIGSAKTTIDMTMYELTDTQAEQLLAQAVTSGVAVRVILDQNLEKSSNTAAYNFLNAHGVQVHWANPKYAATHQKTITVDGATSAIMTLNLTSQYYSMDRDFAVIENDPIDVAAIEATFDADFAASAITPPNGDDLVWSPTNSQSVILGIINAAQDNLLVENEEMGDTAVVNALVSAAKRGVLVHVVMTDSGDYSAEFNQLTAARVGVATYASTASLYIHAKVILADYGSQSARGFAGSENFSNTSLTENRELGLTLTDPSILESLNTTLSSDYTGGAVWPGTQSVTPAITNVVNTASSQAGFASGAWVTIYGTDLAPLTDTWANSIVGGALPTTLDGVSVTIGGEAAYVQYISPTQINAVAPIVTPGTSAIVVNGPNGASASASFLAQAEQPAFFQWGNYAVATHQDYTDAVKNGTFSDATVPAAPGEVIILWGTGFGATTPAAPAGSEVPADTTYNVASPVTVTIGNLPATVYGAALAPGFAALYQVLIQIPDSLASGDWPVVATVAGASSPANVLLTTEK